MKAWTGRQAGAQQSLRVTLEDKIFYVMLSKTGRGGPPLLLRNRRRLCFADAPWPGAAPRHVLGRLLPAKGDHLSVPCAWWDTEMMGSSASLEGLSRLLPLNTPGRLYPEMSPLCTQLARLGCFSLLPLACFWQNPQQPALVSSCFPLLLTPLSSKHRGPKSPNAAGASGLPQDLRGGRDSPFVPSQKVLWAARRRGRRRLL